MLTPNRSGSETEEEGQGNRCWLEVNLDTLASNFASICACTSPLRVITVLKANAYGAGVGPCARRLFTCGARWFGVATVPEACQLQTALQDLDAANEVRIQVVGSVGGLTTQIARAIDVGIVLPIDSLATAQTISKIAVEASLEARCELLIDTGMGRLGVWWQNADEATLGAFCALPNLHLAGLYSHFPHADQDQALCTHQIQRLRTVHSGLCEILRRDDLTLHIGNSDAINSCAASVALPFTAVRVGINLWGSYDMQQRTRARVRPVMTFKARLVSVRLLPAGASVGYACTERLESETLVGTVSAGYADGVPLALSSRGFVLVQGQRCRIIGRVSMDYVTCDVSSLANSVSVGDVVELFGESIQVEEWARIKQTHAWDITCAISSRVPRISVSNQQQQ